MSGELVTTPSVVENFVRMLLRRVEDPHTAKQRLESTLENILSEGTILIDGSLHVRFEDGHRKAHFLVLPRGGERIFFYVEVSSFDMIP